MSKNVAVILAGGSGNRFGESIPKQFLEVEGKTILEYSMLALQRQPEIDEFSAVVSREYFEKVKSLAEKNGCTKFGKTIAGGSERYESSLNAVRAYEDTPDINILLCDSARPVLRQRYITEVIEALKHYNAATIAVPEIDTVLRVNPETMLMTQRLDRNEIFRAHTPQGFKYDVLRKAYEIGLKDPDFNPTDDTGVIFKYLPDEKVYIIKGEHDNIKLTYKQDLEIIRKALKCLENE